MTLPRRTALTSALGAVATSLLLLGCASTVRPATDSTTAGPDGPGGMMGGTEQGYHYSASTCPEATTSAGTAVRVVLADMGMTRMTGADAPLGARMTLTSTPDSVATGAVSLTAQNLGWRTHEVVVLPLTGGAAAGQRVPGADGKVDEAGSLGEASASCAPGSGEGITAGSVGWTTLTLAPGRYELMCNLRNHDADGMYHELDVR